MILQLLGVVARHIPVREVAEETAMAGVVTKVEEEIRSGTVERLAVNVAEVVETHSDMMATVVVVMSYIPEKAGEVIVSLEVQCMEVAQCMAAGVVESWEAGVVGIMEVMGEVGIDK